MARIRDWFDLGKTTINSVTADDLTHLYALEWPETKKVLIAEHEKAIEGERRRIRRWFRTGSAILFGLATGGVMGHWFLATSIFVIGLLGAIPGLLSGATTPSYVSFVISFLIFVFTGLSPH